MLKIRSGIGYDIHRIEKGTGLYLGGVKVSDQLQFAAHSDGDVLIHALVDSLLGAIGEKDIGEFFPDTESCYKNIKSTVLLEKTIEIVEKKNFEIINIDSVIIAETPKISPFKEKIKENIASILGIAREDFNLKAKTKEKTGAVGRGEAMECYCISMVRSKE
ncbi:MAG: 2-C-methyl-D-erythritol 2,4-cyclodiphosphate synthase [Candidatus Aminicenantes bacterium]|nr:MAG: 2-C-methyl-D-erythritol 2,4-cyclodiphosphate synthase [Candidatus Aminicenantes bacterium]